MASGLDWYQKSEAEALKAQGSSLERGLAHEVVALRQVEFGRNAVEDSVRKSVLRILLSQFGDFLVLILLGAAMIASFIGEPQDTVAIVAIIALNAALGFVQEHRAERAIEALRALASPRAKVTRAGFAATIQSVALVPGDIVHMEAGDVVPADIRIIEAWRLQLNESALTGESQPVDKWSRAIAEERLPIAEQRNMAFKGTVVTMGRAKGLVVRIGMATELGRIAGLLKKEIETQTPLQIRLSRFAKSLAFVVLAICGVIFLVGIARGEDPALMFFTAVSLAVAGIPEALPAVVTMSLALGARAMSRRNALVRKLPAVESLGSVTYICSDKTGTLTQNRMQVRGWMINGEFASSLSKDRCGAETWNIALRILALNNDVAFNARGELQGEPTEIALLEEAMASGFDKRELENSYPRVAEIPFSSERGMMSTLHTRPNGGGVLLVKGAPERVLPHCRRGWPVSKQANFDEEGAVRSVEMMAKKGFRVLALAYREIGGDPLLHALSDLEADLVFVGLVGLIDPPRPEAKRAIDACVKAGIRVVMITGDHPATAWAIAEQLGIVRSERSLVMTGRRLREESDSELQSKVLDLSVYARVAPEQKIRIVKALKSQGQIVAMTGDGVNDAPALRSADVGVAMGKGGTDVAREASHMVLLDDHFATVVTAIREGRRIYDNIRKFVRFALSGNSGEIWTLFLAPLVGLPTPLLPIQILWVNLVTDGLPGLALALEPEERNIMTRSPRRPEESIFARGLWQHSVWVGILTAASTLGTLAWAYHSGHAHWQSMAFTVLTFVQMGHVLAIRSETESLFSLGLRTNLPLLGAVILTLGMQICILFIAPLNRIFRTEPLTLNELIICCGVSSSVFISVEIEKWVLRMRGWGRPQ